MLVVIYFTSHLTINSTKYSRCFLETSNYSIFHISSYECELKPTAAYIDLKAFSGKYTSDPFLLSSGHLADRQVGIVFLDRVHLVSGTMLVILG